MMEGSLASSNEKRIRARVGRPASSPLLSSPPKAKYIVLYLPTLEGLLFSDGGGSLWALSEGDVSRPNPHRAPGFFSPDLPNDSSPPPNFRRIFSPSLPLVPQGGYWRCTIRYSLRFLLFASGKYTVHRRYD